MLHTGQRCLHNPATSQPSPEHAFLNQRLKRCGARQCMLVQVRELIYRELLEYHPHMLADYLSGNRQQPSFMYPSAVDNFKRQFAHLEGGGAYGGAAAGRLQTLLFRRPVEESGSCFAELLSGSLLWHFDVSPSLDILVEQRVRCPSGHPHPNCCELCSKRHTTYERGEMCCKVSIPAG